MTSARQPSIRPATRSDHEALFTLYRDLHPDDPSLPAPELAETIWKRIEDDPDYTVLVFEKDGELAASVTIIVIANLTRGGRPYALIENVVTRRPYRERGYASALLHDAIEHARRRGCYKVMLMTGRSDTETLAFYERAGFKQSKTGFQHRFD